MVTSRSHVRVVHHVAIDLAEKQRRGRVVHPSLELGRSTRLAVLLAVPRPLPPTLPLAILPPPATLGAIPPRRGIFRLLRLSVSLSPDLVLLGAVSLTIHLCVCALRIFVSATFLPGSVTAVALSTSDRRRGC